MRAIFDKLSSTFFLTGFILSKLRSVPNRFLSSIFSIGALVTFFIGYSAWCLATFFYPNHPSKNNAWYAFADLKNQFQLSAVLGLVATVLCFINPLLIIPTTWLFMISNMVWSIAEYHKHQNPPSEPYSTVGHAIYLRYVLLITVISTLTAFAATLAVLIPSIASLVLWCSAITGNGLTFVAFYYLKKSLEQENDQPVAISGSSYQKIADTLPTCPTEPQSFPVVKNLTMDCEVKTAPPEEKTIFPAIEAITAHNNCYTV